MLHRNNHSNVVEYAKGSKTWYRRFDDEESASRAASVARDQIGYAWQVDITHWDVKEAYDTFKALDNLTERAAFDQHTTEAEYDVLLEMLCDRRDRCASMLAAYVGIDEDTASDMILYKGDKLEYILGKAA